MHDATKRSPKPPSERTRYRLRSVNNQAYCVYSSNCREGSFSETHGSKPHHQQRGSRKPSFVLCSASDYTALTVLHRTNSPATGLQQPVAPRNKSSQHTLLYTPIGAYKRHI